MLSMTERESSSDIEVAKLPLFYKMPAMQADIAAGKTAKRVPRSGFMWVSMRHGPFSMSML
jgi:hypothetical protein